MTFKMNKNVQMSNSMKFGEFNTVTTKLHAFFFG